MERATTEFLQDDDAAAVLVRERDAVLGIIVAAIHADGLVRDSELREASLQARGTPALGLSGDEVKSRLGEVKAFVKEMGEVAFLAHCVRVLPLETRVKAFHAAIEVMAADHEVPPMEVRYLHRLAHALDVPTILTELSRRDEA